MILVDHFAVVQQSTNQRALAVINAAARNEPQQLLLLMLLQISIDVRRDEVGLVTHGKVQLMSLKLQVASRFHHSRD